ncbi:RHS repeat domain-containing protein [Flagellimonas meishanensis]|uniref:RHS repeat domain-containing protein n=1 Tax=Flagellimonas meishanensis TaxID=2873264 RepID=UPI001CA67521|nr:RHS repeat-associated core domain-containing protein [[Muricauda] meishanensis]
MSRRSGSTYSLADFADTTSDPSIVGEAYGTLGWYYSEQNNNGFYLGNDYQDITDHPFSRTIYSTLNPGSVLKSIGGNKVDTSGDGSIGPGDLWPQAYSFTMPAGQELSQIMAFGSSTYNNLKISKTITRDVHGTENVVFVDTDGKVLASARSGNEQNPNQQKYSVTLSIGEQAYVDIHIPKGCSGVTLSEGPSSGFYRIDVYDLVADTKIFQSLSTLQSGFYRIAVGARAYDGSEPYLVTHDVNYYDYSLNEYDEADRLVKSYQPIGTTKATKPFTEYIYNALGQLVHTISPDKGEAWFKYREDGQIRFSQNSKQRDPNEDSNFADAEFSYTEYDDFGRPIESGVLVSTGFDAADPDGILPIGTKKEQQFTTYDFADDAAMATALGSRAAQYPSQSFVSGNVAQTHNDISETWYSYDVYGRVKWLVQNIQGLGAKTIDYEYDPLTGLVTRVIFQKGVTGEQFIHRYGYDSKDRLIKVETSTDDAAYELHAEYYYYETGGLKRVQLAAGAQGVDYVYNLAGQLKSINHPALNMANDPGSDGNDLFGMQVDYHNNDFARPLTNIGHSTYGVDQYNGNIKGIRWNSGHPYIGESEYVYSYDRNNWLTAANFDPSSSAVGTGGILDIDSSSATFTSGQSGLLEATQRFTLTPSFHAQEGSTVTVHINSTGGGSIMEGDYDVSNITYDANGNIQSLVRNKGSQDGSNAMDALTYVYSSAKPNQLQQVLDTEGDVANAEDIGNQTATDNYQYNSIGQLTDNLSEGIFYIYNASGLVTEVGKDGQPLVKFFYNDRNHRVKKESYVSGSLASTTYYVRDAAGQVMAIYDDRAGSMALAEQPVYGGGRIGVAYAGLGAVENRSYVYELTDHLGNVRAVFTKSGAQSGYGDGFTDYYPFGMSMPGRSLLGPEAYRYAFQGQEKDSETGKEAFELRLWDSRIGRWLTTDPSNQYYSPYLGMGNNAINGFELRGSDWWQLTKDGQLVLIKETSDPFNIFFDSEGQQITNTLLPMPYFEALDGIGPEDKYGKIYDNSRMPEFLVLRLAQIDLIALALYNDDDVYNKMVQRAKETHWKNPELLAEARATGNLAERKAGSAFFDFIIYAGSLAITKNPWSSGGATGLTIFQKGMMTYKFGGFIEAAFNQNDLEGLQKRMGPRLYEMQQSFINNNQASWNFLKWNLGSTNEKKPCRCNN